MSNIKLPKIVRREIYFSSRYLVENRDKIDNKINQCKKEALDLAKLNNYINPKVIQEIYIPDVQYYSLELGGYMIYNSWKECAGAFRYAVTVGEVAQ